MGEVDGLELCSRGGLILGPHCWISERGELYGE